MKKYEDTFLYKLKRRWECFKWGHLANSIGTPVSKRPGEFRYRNKYTCTHCGHSWYGDGFHYHYSL